ncbi:hypothetical protein BX666DRAFT_2031828 [Dichotomocladium elegans]|nr:hypothetical protein BX666DRAFT_2031828 [Dichotomocladium elegans]
MNPDAYFAVGPDGLEVVSQFICLICLTLLASALGSKTSRQKLRSLNYARTLVIILYFFSWAFAASSIILVSTNNHNSLSCALGMYSCDVFYAATKFTIYAWLIERVHMVSAVNTARLKTFQYKLLLCLLLPYIVIFIFTLVFKNITIEEDGTCIIGIQLIASVPVLIYDILFSSYLTWLFVRPLVTSFNLTNTSGGKAVWDKSRLYKLTRRTLASSSVCLTVTFLNALSIVITKGQQRGLVCLTMCTIDVTINVITVHWVTATPVSNDTRKVTGYGRTEEDAPHLFSAHHGALPNVIHPNPPQGLDFDQIDMYEEHSQYSEFNKRTGPP